MATKATKCKRYNGRPYNVRDNVFFENYMEEVAKGMVSLIHARLSCIKNKILAYKPSGFLSRSKASREYGLAQKARKIWFWD